MIHREIHRSTPIKSGIQTNIHLSQSMQQPNHLRCFFFLKVLEHKISWTTVLQALVYWSMETQNYIKSWYACACMRTCTSTTEWTTCSKYIQVNSLEQFQAAHFAEKRSIILQVQVFSNSFPDGQSHTHKWERESVTIYTEKVLPTKCPPWCSFICFQKPLMQFFNDLQRSNEAQIVGVWQNNSLHQHQFKAKFLLRDVLIKEMW